LKNDAAIRKDILDYLAAHPGAQDTSEGIVEWWLLEQKIERATPAVKAALSRLVSEKKLRAKKGPDGRVHYRLMRQESKKAHKTLG
jgi:hypothetical protein